VLCATGFRPSGCRNWHRCSRRAVTSPGFHPRAAEPSGLQRAGCCCWWPRAPSSVGQLRGRWGWPWKRHSHRTTSRIRGSGPVAAGRGPQFSRPALPAARAACWEWRGGCGSAPHRQAPGKELGPACWFEPAAKDTPLQELGRRRMGGAGGSERLAAVLGGSRWIRNLPRGAGATTWR